MAIVWTPVQDQLLLDMKGSSAQWSVILPKLSIPGLTKKDALAHYKALLKQSGVEAKKTTPDEPPTRDGLAWLVDPKRKVISRPQCREGIYYRDLFRVAEPGAMIQSSIESLGMGGGSGRGGGVMLGGSYEDAAAKLELFVIRKFLFGDQEDLITAMDGVCGQGWTLRYLAGGDHHRAKELETALRIALDLMLNNRKAKDEALAAQKKVA